LTVAVAVALPLANLEALERDGTGAQLRAIAVTVTPEEHERLRALAAAGDRLAELIVGVLGRPLEVPVALRCLCGGTTWLSDPGRAAEWCVECGAWSPVSVGVEGR
jgi:hypothetical protein